MRNPELFSRRCVTILALLGFLGAQSLGAESLADWKALHAADNLEIRDLKALHAADTQLIGNLKSQRDKAYRDAEALSPPLPWYVWVGLGAMGGGLLTWRLIK